MPVVFDITRLIARSHMPTATGIDRVEIAYAVHYAKREDTQFVMSVPHLGPMQVPRHRILPTIARVNERWSRHDQQGRVEDDVTLVREKLNRTANSTAAKPGLLKKLICFLLPDHVRDLLSYTLNITRFLNPGRPTRSVDDSHIYIHVSHVFLQMKPTLEWFQKNGYTTYVLIHDLIPITFPEYCGKGASKRHALRIENMLRYADTIICNSENTRIEIERFANAHDRRVPRFLANHIGTDFNDASPTINPILTEPYFIVVGTIEARKNHIMLLQVWREIALQFGTASPKLLIIGRRGWQADAATDMIDRCAVLRDKVFELGTVSDSILKILLKGATGALVPSFVEGFSYPVVEAVHAGVPVVASDIPVHREMAGDAAWFVPPLDGPGWKAAVMELVNGNRDQWVPVGHGDVAFQFSWARHFDILDDDISANRSDTRDTRQAERG